MEGEGRGEGGRGRMGGEGDGGWVRREEEGEERKRCALLSPLEFPEEGEETAVVPGRLGRGRCVDSTPSP